MTALSEVTLIAPNGWAVVTSAACESAEAARAINAEMRKAGQAEVVDLSNEHR